MTDKKVILSETVRQDIGAISDFIISVSRPEHAERYTQNLLDELADLSYLATMRPKFHGNCQNAIIVKQGHCRFVEENLPPFFTSKGII